MTRFSYVKYDDISVRRQEALKAMFEDIEKFVEHELPPTRERSLVLTALEEAYMWTGKAIRDEQIARNVRPEHVPERG